MGKSLQCSVEKGCLRVHGYPDAIALKQTNDEFSSELKSICLHEVDLMLSQSAVSELLRSSSLLPDVLTDGLWIAAVSGFFKCFGRSKSRQSLNKETIFAGRQDALDCFIHFKVIRDKHIIHDENALSQSFVGIVINPSSSNRVIADAVSIALRFPTRSATCFQSFGQLVDLSLSWVRDRRETLHKLVVEKYSLLSREDLLQLPDVNFTAPTVPEFSSSR